MLFDVSYLGVSLKDLTWLEDHETGENQAAATTVRDSDGLEHQVASTADRELRRHVEEEPLRALRLLKDAYIESLPEQMRSDILLRRQELDLAQARLNSASP